VHRQTVARDFKKDFKMSTINKIRLLRRFFGIHFDFHAREDCLEIGKTPFERTLKALLIRCRPDFVQCDCKGHPGISSYPTRVGTSAPGFVRDSLKIWRRVTARHGVALYMHYSGVWDNAAIARNPTWALIDKDGKRDPTITSVFGPYVDELLIPQMQELVDKYGVDGFWVDGDCWATCHDYGKKVLEAFHRETGIGNVPREPKDPHFYEFTEFCREGFRRYLRRYVNEVHRRCPGTRVASNWAFSSYMPEPVTVDVDFLSGDYSLTDSVNSARLQARCLMHQGKPWDLMAWGFGSEKFDLWPSSKSAVQLQREAAVVLALGGGFQVYFVQRRDASIVETDVDIIEKVAAFCRRRQRWCQDAVSVPQIALLYSGEAFRRNSPRLCVALSEEMNPMLGTLNALLNNQYAVDILSEHHLTGVMHRYPLIVVPEWGGLDKAFRNELVAYAKKGGKLLVTGANAIPIFSAELGIEIVGKPEDRPRWLEAGDGLAGLKSFGVPVRVLPGTSVIGSSHAVNDPSSPGEPAAFLRRCGKGLVAGLGVDFGAGYRTGQTWQARKFMRKIIERLKLEPKVRVIGSEFVDVTLMTKNDDLLVHLINTSGCHSDKTCYTHDEVTPLGPLELKIRLETKPKSIHLQPMRCKMPFTWGGGWARLTLPRLEIHTIVQVRRNGGSL
jgi:hypothetical protein